MIYFTYINIIGLICNCLLKYRLCLHELFLIYDFFSNTRQSSPNKACVEIDVGIECKKLIEAVKVSNFDFVAKLVVVNNHI